MTKEEYIKISQVNGSDKLPLLYYFYTIKKDDRKQTLSNYDFYILFDTWLMMYRIDYDTIFTYVIKELDKHFDI